jgi:Lectin C-type domain
MRSGYTRSMLSVYIGGVLFLGSSLCNAIPMQWAANGHYYDVVTSSGVITWSEAEVAARVLSWQGFQGHLATITSQAENNFIRGILPSQTFQYPTCWIGGFQAPGSLEPNGGWGWVTGELWVYGNWAAGEPSNSPPGEGFLEIYANQGSWWGQWNDNYDASGYNNTRYVVEYEAAQVVPDGGATALLLCLASLGLHWLRGLSRPQSSC